jgi:ribonuclease HII
VRFVKSGVRTTKNEFVASSPPATSRPHFDFELEAFAKGHRWVAGVDEVGRGPLAGPVGVAAVILDPDDLPFGVDDSKALPEAQRELLCEIIFAKALSVSIVFASVEEIDAMNIRGAALSAMARAVAGLSLRPDLALIDGRDSPDGLICAARPISAATHFRCRSPPRRSSLRRCATP